MFNSIRFYCSLPGWVIKMITQIDHKLLLVDKEYYIKYGIVEDALQTCYTEDREQHAAYYNELLNHLNTVYKRDKAEYVGIITGLFLGNVYRGVDDDLIELIRKNQKDHLKEFDLDD